MGCASGKKPPADCKPLAFSSSQAVLHIQVPFSLTMSEKPAVEGVGALAPVTEVLWSEREERPKAMKAALPPKKTLIQPQFPIEVQPSLPSKPKKALKTTTQPLAICPSSTEPSLASARNISGSKAAFDKSKFRLANTSPATPLAEQKPLAMPPLTAILTGPVVVAKTSLEGFSTLASDSR